MFVEITFLKLIELFKWYPSGFIVALLYSMASVVWQTGVMETINLSWMWLQLTGNQVSRGREFQLLKWTNTCV